MSMPFYVPPEQIMREKAEYARKGISRGRSVVAMLYADGVLFVADNPSAHLRKTSEVYDRLGFAAVGKYSEFEQLRVAGIRVADVRGYQYAREDVTGRTIANAYANFLGQAFTEGSKPAEVELLLVEVTSADAEIYHILYDGSITDEEGHVVIGGQAEDVRERLAASFQPDLDLGAAVRMARQALSGEDEPLPPSSLEVSGLDRTRGRRKFFRVAEPGVAALVEGAAGS